MSRQARLLLFSTCLGDRFLAVGTALPFAHGVEFSRYGVEQLELGHIVGSARVVDSCAEVGHFDHRHSGSHHVNLLGGSLREIDEGIGTERASVGNLYEHFFAVLRIAHVEDGAERQGLVSASERVVAEDGTISTAATVPFAAIIGGVALGGLCHKRGGEGEEGEECQ